MKKLIAYGVVPVAVAALLAGCSGSDGESSTTEDGKAKLEVLAVLNALTKDLNDIPYMNDSQEMADVEIEWTQVRSGWDEQKNPILASGDLPDIFISAIGNNDIMTFTNQFLPLGDLIKEHAPNIKKMFEEMPEVKELATTIDGEIYGLPAVTPHNPASTTIPMMNQQWLDELGLEAPTTFDELYDVLKAFKEEDPNGNGSADEIPFDWGPDQGPYSAMALLGAYGNYAPHTDWFNTVKDGEHVYVPATEDYKELVQFLHSLYAEGLINQEVFTQDWSQFFSRSQNPDAATVGFTIGWSFEQRVGEWSDQYTVIAPPAAEAGIAPLWPGDPVQMRAGTNKAVVAASVEDPVAAIKWLDTFYSEELSAQGYYGSFDVGIEEDGQDYVVVEPPEGTSEDEWKWTNSLVDHGLMYVPDELDARIIAPPTVAERLEQNDELLDYFPADEQILPPLKFTAEEDNELSILYSDLNNLVSRKWSEWVTQGGVEDEWDAYIEELNRIGLERYSEIYQGSLDR
ncbi:putative aldouronate transport system substrate-binding protein [Alkalihalobacillus xiaoxiensis]|uniref:Aldouronate transport system substrate-binding protein n=1 Tax=Shouchella xiaoxiensis TaxID=766895 RepID=A0ABS2SMW7_9BACI|nr:extracellular solute-binding protein [Shouchella xiaoxiensis]MBM7836868.1 putative aldouronate transport system substrate-binding protein [Shouchella xiaoxiensis]